MNILIVGGSLPYSGANSVCVRNLSLAFKSLGHQVWNIAEGDNYTDAPFDMDGIKVWHVPEEYYGRLLKNITAHPTIVGRMWLKIISVIRHLLLLPLYPVTEPKRTRNLYHLAKKIVEECAIDLVIAIHNSYANISTGMRLKKKYAERLKVVSYHLDLRTASVNSSSSVRQYIHRHALKSLVEECNIVDKMLIPYSGQKDIEVVDGIQKSKIQYVGFPVFTNEGTSEAFDLPFDKDSINISYIGTLSADNRNPQYILKLLESVSKRINRRILVHIWGDTGELWPLLNESAVAKYHGTVDNRFARYIMDNSDFLLNIGNAIAYNMLPSKVFGMFATGKPIINVINHPEDASLSFFKRYNNSIDIVEYDKSVDNEEILENGIRKTSQTSLSDTEGLFDDFKPSYICEIILEKEKKER